MSTPHEPEPAKLFLSAIYRGHDALHRALERIEQRMGPVDFATREISFDKSSYYHREMGAPLFRRFFTYKDPVAPDALSEIKLFTNSIELDETVEESRAVNLDPGLISLGSFILATGKNPGHRVYLAQGIYADLTLTYKFSSYQPNPWTYPDYATPEIISFLNRVREAFKQDLRQPK